MLTKTLGVFQSPVFSTREIRAGAGEFFRVYLIFYGEIGKAADGLAFGACISLDLREMEGRWIPRMNALLLEEW